MMFAILIGFIIGCLGFIFNVSMNELRFYYLNKRITRLEGEDKI